MQNITDNAARTIQVNTTPMNKTSSARVHLTLVGDTSLGKSASRRTALTKEEAVRAAMLRTG